jgi:hypothetical protein
MVKSQFAKLTTRVTRSAFDLLKAECERRHQSAGYYIPYGAVVNELILAHLPVPQVPGGYNPEVQKATAAPVILQKPAARRRGRPSLSKVG